MSALGIGIIILGFMAGLLIYIYSRKCRFCKKIVWFSKNTCKESQILCDFSGYETTYWHRSCDKWKEWDMKLCINCEYVRDIDTAPFCKLTEKTELDYVTGCKKVNYNSCNYKNYDGECKDFKWKNNEGASK